MQKLLEFGANDIAFEPLVLAGSNSALCHGHSRDDYQIKKGDCILFDFGANVNGYNSDITRTFFLVQSMKKIETCTMLSIKQTQLEGSFKTWDFYA